MIIETGKEHLETVFNFFKNNRIKVFQNPDKEIMNRYVKSEKNAVIVIPLTTEAPVRKYNGTSTVTIEKLLVDVFSNKSISNEITELELKNIFISAFDKYTINENRLLRYANRRKKKKELVTLLNTVVNPSVTL